MSTIKNNLNTFMKDRFYELIFNMDETMHDYSKYGDRIIFQGRISRILFLIKSYCNMFDLCELGEFSDRLEIAYSRIGGIDDVPKGELLGLTHEVRECLLEMVLAITVDNISPSLYRTRALAVADSIGSLSHSNTLAPMAS